MNGHALIYDIFYFSSHLGRNTNLHIGIEHEEEEFPQRIPGFLNEEILGISCGAQHSLVLTSKGLFGFGENTEAELGIGHNMAHFGPAQLPFFSSPTFTNEDILGIACGAQHSLVLTSKGLFGFGKNNYGELGPDHARHQMKPKLISFFSDQEEEVLSIACGGNHSLVLTSRGLFSFGRNNQGQLGLGTTHLSSISEVFSSSDQQVQSMSCGENHSVVLTSAGLFSFGANEWGQLGLGHKDPQSVPQKIIALSFEKPISVSCGAYHSLILTDSGLFSFGRNIFGELGITPGAPKHLPEKISFFANNYNSKILSISCGATYSLVLTQEALFSFGANNISQGLPGRYVDPIKKVIFFPDPSSLYLFDAFQFQAEEENRKRVLELLLCCQKFDPFSFFSLECLPQDIFKYIISLAQLTEPFKPKHFMAKSMTNPTHSFKSPSNISRGLEPMLPAPVLVEPTKEQQKAPVSPQTTTIEPRPSLTPAWALPPISECSFTSHTKKRSLLASLTSRGPIPNADHRDPEPYGYPTPLTEPIVYSPPLYGGGHLPGESSESDRDEEEPSTHNTSSTLKRISKLFLHK